MNNSSDKKAASTSSVSATTHLVRLAGAIVLLGLGFGGIRTLAVPESFGRDGHYRANAVDEIVSAEPVHAGPGPCAECHKDQTAKLPEGVHKGLSCEGCHGPGQGHLTLTEERTAMQVSKERSLCLNCHGKLTGRPSTFPQIEGSSHMGGGETPCIGCHNPHSPGF